MWGELELCGIDGFMFMVGLVMLYSCGELCFIGLGLDDLLYIDLVVLED